MQARKYVPDDLPLVNFFGWTLGGFYLARYSHSPVGAFDELVALAGLAWNFPTSCAWAARVYVNNVSARNHGLTVVGLPSRLATFRAQPKPRSKRERRKPDAVNWWSNDDGGQKEESNSSSNSNDSRYSNDNSSPVNDHNTSGSIEIRNVERRRMGILQRIQRACGRKDVPPPRGLSHPVCSIEIPELRPQFMPSIQMGLPSYSGATPLFPGLLKYSLRLYSKIRFIPPLKITVPRHDDYSVSCEEGREESLEALGPVLGGRPLLCMSFEDMRMDVEAPTVLPLPSNSS